MTLFLIQSLLWLLAAFFLGYGLGRWLKGVFCKRPHVDTRTKLETETSRLRVPVTTAAVATGTAAASALARSRESVKPTVTVKQPVVTAKIPEVKASVTPLKTADIAIPKAEIKAPEIAVTTPKMELKTPVIDLSKLEAHAPKVTMDLPKVEVNTPQIDLSKVDVTIPKVDVELPKLDLRAPNVSVDLPTLDVKVPEVNLPNVAVDLPKISLPTMGVTAPKLAIDVPKLNVSAPEISLPQVDISAPRLDLDLPKVEVGFPQVDLPKVDVTIPKVDVELPKLDLRAPNVSVDLPTLDVKVPEMELPNIAVDLPNISLPKVEVTAPKLEIDVPKVNVPEISLPQVDVSAPRLDLDLPKMEVGFPQVDLPTPSVDLPNLDVAAPQIDLPTINVDAPKFNLELPQVKDIATGMVGLGAAALGVVAVKMQAPDGEVDLTLTELVKPLESEVDLKTLQLNLPDSKADLSAVEWHNQAASVDAVALNLPEVQVDLPDANLPKIDLGLAAANIHTPDGKIDLTALRIDVPDTSVHLPEAGIELERAQVSAGLLELNTPDGLYTVEGAKVQALDHPEGAIAVRLTKPDGEVQLASFATDSSDRQGLNTEALAGLTLAAASAGTVAAVQANLQSGVQPMIVDESDAIEAIKLAWDGELSPAELAALEHTLILRPGETGRLGLVTCSVTGANCVSLGGLEADLQAGDAMRSNLFNMAVTHNDDGNYVFSSLSKWLPDWIKSGDFSEHTDELTHLVWDNDPSAVDYSAGYELILCEGQYGNLGLVSCAVNEPGSVSLGGIVGSVAEGQTAVSKLYGILVERAGEVYTFKQFLKPADQGSWLATAKAAVVAVGAGAVAQASDAVAAVKDAVMPVTKSTTTDMLEPSLAWDNDKIRMGVQRLIAESQDRRGSKLVSQLWGSDSGYDCGVIEGEESLILKPGLYGKLGSVHCGVTKPGRVVVSGDVSALAEGEGVLFHLYNIVACRDDDDNYRFERLKDLV